MVRRNILALCIAIAVIAMVIVPVMAETPPPPTLPPTSPLPKQKPNEVIWELLTILQNQITYLQAQLEDIQLTPGPEGPPGPQGETGTCSCEVSSEDFKLLKDRVTDLEQNQVKPIAAFSSDVQTGMPPLTVKFTGSSSGTGPFTWAWDFDNDGSVDSGLQNPSYIYTSAGTYTVKLTVTGQAGSDDEIKTDYIVVTPPVPPTADFWCDPLSGSVPLIVYCHDTTTGTGPFSKWWEFGDGGLNEGETNPSHKYTVAGSYNVRLFVQGPGGSDDEIKFGYITVSA
jgi:PKD repeat protein